MAGIFQRGKKWYLFYSVGKKQKRVALDTPCKQLAEEKLRQFESAQFRGASNPLPTKTPLAQIIERYVFQLKARSKEGNVKKVVSYLRGTFGQITDCLKITNQKIADKSVKCPSPKKIDLIEVRYIEEITPEQVSEFLAKLVAVRGVGNNTVNHFRQNILTLCNWSATEGGVRFPGAVNPVANLKPYRVNKGDVTILKVRDIHEQLSALAGNILIQTMVAVYIYAGLRRAEALWLMPSDVELEAGHWGTIRVCGKKFNGTEWVPKTGKNRTVPISKTLRKYLDAYLAQVKPSVWFFAAPEGGRWDPDNFSEDLRDINTERGLSWSCLDYRHTFGSHLAMSGKSLLQISQLMGNSEAVCRKHYLHFMPEALYAAVEFGHPDPPAVPETVMETPNPTRTPAAVVGAERPKLRLVVNNR